MWKDGLGKWCHNLSIIVGDEFKCWDSSLNLGLREESNDSKLGKTSIIDLLDKTFGLVFLRSVLAPAKRVEKVKGATWDNLRPPYAIFRRAMPTLTSYLHNLLTGLAWWTSSPPQPPRGFT